MEIQGNILETGGKMDIPLEYIIALILKPIFKEVGFKTEMNINNTAEHFIKAVDILKEEEQGKINGY